MKLSDLLQCSHQKQAEIVRKQGTLLAVLTAEINTTYLYYMGNFFAEIFKNKSDSSEYVMCFSGVCLLNRYTDLIDLSEITR